MKQKKILFTIGLAIFTIMVSFQFSMPVQAAKAKKISEMTAVDVKGSVENIDYYKNDRNQPVLSSYYKGDYYITILDKNGKTTKSINASKLMREFTKNWTYKAWEGAYMSDFGKNEKDMDVSNVDNIFYYYCSYDKSGDQQRFYYTTITNTGKCMDYIIVVSDDEVDVTYSPFGSWIALVTIEEKAVKGKKISLYDGELGKTYKTNVKYNSKYEVASITHAAGHQVLSVYNTKNKTYRLFYATSDSPRTFKKITAVQNKKANITAYSSNSYVVAQQNAKEFRFTYYAKMNKAGNKATIKITNKKKACAVDTQFGAVVCTGNKNYVFPYKYSSLKEVNKVKKVAVSYKAENIMDDVAFYQKSTSVSDDIHLMADKTGYLRVYKSGNKFKKYSNFRCEQIKNKKYTKFLHHSSDYFIDDETIIDGVCIEPADYSTSYLYISTGNKANYSDAKTYRIALDSFMKNVK